MTRTGSGFAIGLSALLACAGAGSIKTAHADPAPGQFDHLVLAMSDEAEFCARHGADKSECLGGGRGDGLVLHGLWPSQSGDPLGYNYCLAPPVFASGDDCGLVLPSTLEARLEAVMPATKSCLQRHEWQKHGTCSGLDATSFFANSVTLAERFRSLPALSTVLRDHAGKSVPTASLWAALVHDLGPGIKIAAKLECDAGGGSQSLSEIQIALDKGRFMSFPAPESLAGFFPGNRADHLCDDKSDVTVLK